MHRFALLIFTTVIYLFFASSQTNKAFADSMSAASNDPGNECKRVFPVTVDYLSCLKTAAEQGSGIANAELGSIYQVHLVAKDILEAAGLPPFQFGAGDNIQSEQFYKRAADAGNTSAMRELARLNFLGLSGGIVDSDADGAAQGIEWLRKAEAGGSWFAVEGLCEYYGEVKDFQSQNRYCMKVFNRLSVGGRPPGELADFPQVVLAHRATAEYTIATLYRDGLGVSKNEAGELYWLKKAAADGNQDAAAEIKKVSEEVQEHKQEQEAQRKQEVQDKAKELAFRVSMLKRKEVGDYVCTDSWGGYVERVSDDRVQIRVHHHFPMDTHRDYDELIWTKYSDVGTLCDQD